MNSQYTSKETIDHETHSIIELLDDYSVNEISLNDSGWDSRVYYTNDYKYFFKFPRSAKIKSRYTQEIAILKQLTRIQPRIMVPEIRWEHPNNDYFGYKGVQGVLLSEVITSLSQTEKQRVGSVLGEFLNQLHTLELPGARDISVDREIAQLHEWYPPSKTVLQAALASEAFARLEKYVYDTWPNELQRLKRQSGLCHGDLHFKNILYNEGGLGIIDFGDVGYYDISKDFIDLDDNDVFESALKAYGDSEFLRQKITVRKHLSYIITLTAAIGKNNTDEIEQVLAKLKSVI